MGSIAGLVACDRDDVDRANWLRGQTPRRL